MSAGLTVERSFRSELRTYYAVCAATFHSIDSISFVGVFLLFPAVALLAPYLPYSKPCASILLGHSDASSRLSRQLPSKVLLQLSCYGLRLVPG